MGGHAGGRAVGGGNRTSDRAGPNYGRVSRAALLASASLVALVMPGAAWAACTPSTRTISTGVTGPVLSNGGSILVTGGGSIAGGAEGVFAENCSITTLSNKGAIGAASGAPGGAGGIGVLTNSGRTINLLSNANGATISGGKEGGGSASGLGGAGVSNAGTITKLTNAGKIDGGSGGSFGGHGLSNAGTITTLINSGAVSGGAGGSTTFGAGGEGGVGVSNAAHATIGSLTNTRGATISGGNGGSGALRWPWRPGRIEQWDDQDTVQ